MDKGQVISGEFGRIAIRQKSGCTIELGELLVSDAEGGGKVLMQAYDIGYGSQLARQNLELISGMMLEEGSDLSFMDPELRNYSMAMAKNILFIDGSSAKVCKTMPAFFSMAREVTSEDLRFLTRPKNSLFAGRLRSGSKVLDVDILLDGSKVLAEHVLIAASTGKGKSNLAGCMLFDSVGKEYAGMLVLDPHDEYYGRNSVGLKDHPDKKHVVYYSRNAPPGARTLKICTGLLRPEHFDGSADWSGPQREALMMYYRQFGEGWVEAAMTEKKLDASFHEGTLGVVKRRVGLLLGIDASPGGLSYRGVFDSRMGSTTLSDICRELEESRTVIVDTSDLPGSTELLVGSMISGEVLRRYRRYKSEGTLGQKPVISIVLEEAPRVIGKDALEKGPNIFSTIAREGRKFKVGLFAITQLPSLIPREILANMNTKIIMGLEMAPERQAVIDSASHDLSSDGRNIASLDKGEAIITSNFTRFAVPVKAPYLPELAKDLQNRANRELYFEKARAEKQPGSGRTPGENPGSPNADSQQRIAKSYPGVVPL